MTTAAEIMETNLITTRVEETVATLCDRLQTAHVHSAPVVDEDGRLVGIVSLEDILFGAVLGRTSGAPAIVRDVMTSPAFSATEDASIQEICDLMWSYRVHHLPIVRGDVVIGIVSSLDICRQVRSNPPATDAAAPGA